MCSKISGRNWVLRALHRVSEDASSKGQKIRAGIDEHGKTVAIAYHLQKVPYVFPIIGGRKVEHLHENIEALDITLTAEQIKRIEDAKPLDPGFPHSMLVCLFLLSFDHPNFVDVFVHQGDGTHESFLSKWVAYYDRVPAQQAIAPTKEQ